jgi:hypothetical protein
MTNWDEFHFEPRIRAILRDAAPSSSMNPHFGRPFLTVYQLAIEFNERHSSDVEKLGLQVGGKGTGQHVSLAQYIARELSRRLGSKNLEDIEGALLSRQRVASHVFTPDDIESSAEGAWDLSMYRLRSKSP